MYDSVIPLRLHIDETVRLPDTTRLCIQATLQNTSDIFPIKINIHTYIMKDWEPDWDRLISWTGQTVYLYL